MGKPISGKMRRPPRQCSGIFAASLAAAAFALFVSYAESRSLQVTLFTLRSSTHFNNRSSIMNDHQYVHML